MTGAIATSTFQGYWPSSSSISGENRVRGSGEAREAPSGREEEPSTGSCWASSCSYGELASDRLMVTNLRLPGQYDERLLGSVGLQGPYYNWNRWYLPSMGRYLELDPIAKAGGFNGFYGPNWYGYAEGNPLRWIDPRGLDETSWGPFGPKNGNWGGWCWSGGQYCVFGPGKEPPLDTGDEVYQRHDQCIAECEGIPGGSVSRNCYVLCDKLSLDELNGLDPDPMKWPRPPKPEFLDDTRKYCEDAKRLFTCNTNPDACRGK